MNENIKQRVIEVPLEQEMKQSYIDYAMSVIVGRALPDVRDGLKPVHRRILYSMYEMGLLHNKPYKKSARVVGDVLGKYHPHGDASVYDALVRMAQDFVMNHVLVDGHGNFGSIDGDPPAAMRYTEVRLSKVAEEILKDIDKDTVDFVPNFDGSLKEPVVLPACFPNLLVNGSAGIAVGMATNIPPHNLGEVIDALVFLIDNPDASISELMRFIKGPDFPTGGMIMGTSGIMKAYETGKGMITIRSKLSVEKLASGGSRIVVSEIPYQVNKARMIEEIAELVKAGVIEGIRDIRDESDREGLRIVIDVKRDVKVDVLLNQLYKHTSLEIKYGILNLALVDNQPKLLNLKELLVEFLKHRFNVIRRRTAHELKNARERAHVIAGLLIALQHIDEVIELIKKSKDKNEAASRLISSFGIDEKQAEAILQMQLHKLTSLEREKLEKERKELEEMIKRYERIMSSDEEVYRIIKDELLEIKNKYSRPRRTEISEEEAVYEEQDLIMEEDVIVTFSSAGYIKRMSLKAYRTQRKGGTGSLSFRSRNGDYIKSIVVCNTHDMLLFFSNKGVVRAIRAYEVPEAGRYAKGKPITHILKLQKDEKIAAMVPILKSSNVKYLLMVTRNGIVKKTNISAFSSIRKSGIIAIKLRDGDKLVGVIPTTGDDEILLATRKGMAIRFDENDVRPMGRAAAGVIGMRLQDGDYVVSAANIVKGGYILTATTKGFVKKTREEEYRTIKRGGKGIINIKLSEKNGDVVAALCVTDGDEIVAVTKGGALIKVKVSEIRSHGRPSMGVRLIRLKEDDMLVDVAKVPIQ